MGRRTLCDICNRPVDLEIETACKKVNSEKAVFVKKSLFEY